MLNVYTDERYDKLNFLTHFTFDNKPVIRDEQVIEVILFLLMKHDGNGQQRITKNNIVNNKMKQKYLNLTLCTAFSLGRTNNFTRFPVPIFGSHLSPNLK